MDFARRQLEKYGWSDGKGLGKNENGISEALKPKLKRSVTGIGHDPASEFNEHWWSALYDKAAKNVEVKEKNGKTKKIKSVSGEDFTITNNTWRINKKYKDSEDNEYSDYFVRKAVLTNDGSRVENVAESEEGDDVGDKKDVFKMTDEELFAACEGRTAHKGARHGLKALGKLARIAQQEQMLLAQSKYEGYSHAKKIKQKSKDIVEDTSLVDPNNTDCKIKKKKKRKRCFSNENGKVCDQAESESQPEPISKSKKNNGAASVIKQADIGRKSKKSKKLASSDVEVEDTVNNENDTKIKKKKKRKLEEAEAEISETKDVGIEEVFTELNVRKKKKRKHDMEEQ